MRMKKIALWLFIAIILSGLMLGFGYFMDAKKSGGFENMTFGLGTSYDINKLEEIDLSQSKKIEIRTTCSDTSLFKTNSGKVKASLTGRVVTTDAGAVPTLEVRQSGDILYITEKRTSGNSFITWSFSTNNLKLDISIPESFKGEVTFNGSSGGFTTSNMSFERLDLDLSSGDIDLTNLTLEKDLKVSSSSGNIKIAKVTAQNTQIKSTSGDKTFEGFTLTGDMQLNSSSGNTRMKDISCTQITLDSTSGDVTAERIKVNHMQAKSSSGKVEVKDLEGGAQIKATSGNIEVTASQPSGELNLSASSGNVKLTLPANTGFGLDAHVSSGNIRCAFDLANQVKEEKSLKGAFGNGAIPVRIDTTSGDITINKG